MTEFSIREIPKPRSEVCEAIMRNLPEWFGIDSYIQSYARDAETYLTYGAYGDEKDLLGFMTLRPDEGGAHEIHAMGVLPDCQGRGIGRALVEHAREISIQRGYRLLRVKTLGPSHPDPWYEGTRAFYGKMGFTAIEERLDIWPGNPCQILEMSLVKA